MKPSPLNQFICVGAARSGTTTVWSWLDQHPAVNMSAIKETNFFTRDLIGRSGPGDAKSLPSIANLDSDIINNPHAAIVENEHTYRRLLASEKTTWSGEVSPSYLYFAKQAAPRIHEFNSACKIIILLREPVSRALSNHSLFVNLGREDLCIKEALHNETERLAKGWEHAWAYRGLGLYHESCKIYIDTFGRENVLILLYDDLAGDSNTFNRKICQFLAIDIVPPRVQEQINASHRRPSLFSTPNKRLARAIGKFTPTWIRNAVNGTDELIAKKLRQRDESLVRAELKRFYYQDVLATSQLAPDLEIATRWKYA